MFKKFFQPAILTELTTLQTSQTPITVPEVQQLLTQFVGGNGGQMVRAANRIAQLQFYADYANQVAEALSLFENRNHLALSIPNEIILLLALIEIKIQKPVATLPHDSLLAKICAAILARLSIDKIPDSLIVFAYEKIGAGYVGLQSLDAKSREQINRFIEEDKLIAILGNHASLKSLEITKTRVSDSDVEQLTHILQFNSTVTTLTIRSESNNFGDIAARGLAKCTRLLEMDISHSQVGDDGVIAIATQNTQLRKLFIACTKVSDAGVVAAARHPHLTHLALAHYKMSPAIAAELSQNTRLQKLGMYYSSPGNAGLAILFGNKLMLTMLDARNCGIDANGAKILANLTSLMSLHLDSNQVSGDSLTHLLNRLQKLTHIGLGRNQLQSPDYVAINAATQLMSVSVEQNNILPADVLTFSGNTTLQSLDLSHNHFKFTNIQGLSLNTTLKSLNLAFNFNGVLGLEFVNAMNLTRLDVSYNGLTAAGTSFIAHNTTLRELVIGNNGIGDGGLAAISANSTLTYLNMIYSFESGYGYTHVDDTFKNINSLFSDKCMLLRLDMSRYGRPYREIDAMLDRNRKRFEEMAVLGYVWAKTIYTLAGYTNGYLPVQKIIAFMFGTTDDCFPVEFKNRIINGVNFFNQRLNEAAKQEAVSTSTADSLLRLQ